MLKEAGAKYTYREYTLDPLSASELKALFAKLEESPRDMLRKAEAKKAGLTGDESDAELLAAMAENPTLLQRPILVKGRKAVVGRPVENLSALL
ncbi:MAG: arsenate reductase [Pseudohongiellaceae bacterium]